MLKIECETSLTYNLEEKEAILWTCQPKMLRKMAKMGVQVMRNDGEGKAFKIPKDWISIRKPRIVNMTPEQRKAVGERLKIKSKAV